MLKRSTVFALILLAALVGLAFYLSRQKQDEGTDTVIETPSTTLLFDETSGQVEGLTITDASGKVVSVRRDAAAGWRYEQPVSMEADAGLVEAAASQVMSLRVLNSVEIPLTTVGLNRPAFTLTVRFDTGKEAILKIGDTTPTQSGYYVLKESGEVVIINKYSLDSLLELFHNPPQPPTPTPSAGDDQTATPTTP